MSNYADIGGGPSHTLQDLSILQECPDHGYTVAGKRELDDHWGLVVAEFNKGRVAWAKGLSLSRYKELIKETYDEYSGDCIGCAKNARE